MTSTASSSMSRRMDGSGHAASVTCSLSASPLPTPRAKRPGIMHATVAAACAITAGWVRIVGQVTAVVTRRSVVAVAMPPRTDQTNGLWPCRSIHGW
jgi:hypothetical protein